MRSAYAGTYPQQIEAVADRGRIHLIDNIRGLALIAILLLHCVEHFSLYVFPEAGEPGSLPSDGAITHIAFLLFFGKAHGIFAFLFGVSYHIQEQNNRRKCIAHRSRMIRRMGWLFVFGIFHGLFYPGDILCLLALFGMLLLLIGKTGSRALLVIATILFLQPLLLMEFLFDIERSSFGERHWDGLIGSLRDDAFLQLIANNLVNNRLIEWSLGLSSGRIFQLCAWMLLGVVAARNGYFDRTRIPVWSDRILFASACIGYLVLAFASDDPAMADLVARWKEALMVAIYVSGAMLFARIWQKLNEHTLIANYGRMSLTNYVGQGVIGSILFYGYGASLYQLGATFSLLIAFIILVLQFTFCWWWSQKKERGPLEKLWADLVDRSVLTTRT